MSEFLRAKKAAQARDAEKAKELERLKRDAEERKAEIERQARERERRDREEEIAHLKKAKEVEAASARPNPLEVRPKSQKYQEPRGPGSVALHKIRSDLKKPNKSSTSPSPGPSRPTPKPFSSSSQPSTSAARSHSLPSSKHKAPTKNAPPRITANASQSHTARGKMSLEMAGQPTLHALNQNKRDLRSIDEIERDIKAKRLALGRESDKIVVEKPKVNGFFDEPPPAPVVKPKVQSNANALAGSSKSAFGSSSSSKPVERTSSGVPRSSSLPTSNSKSKPSPASKPSNSKASQSTTQKANKATASTSSPRKVMAPPKTKVPTKRRERERSTSSESETDSEEEYARRRSRMGQRSPPPGPGRMNASEEIWKLFGRGKTKQDYLARDLSDSGSDMEVSAEQLAREEARTARIAREEDARAEAEERRHAEAKRRRLGKK